MPVPVDAKGILYMVAENEFGLKRDTIENRLKLQKTIYLLEAYGMQLGYGFSWYKYGPYSQDLVRDAYTVLRSEKKKYDKATSSWCFSETTRKKIDQFKQICKDFLGDLRQLELVASVDFVFNTWYSDEADTEKIVDNFKKHKKQLYGGVSIEDRQIKEAFEFSKELRGCANTTA